MELVDARTPRTHPPHPRRTGNQQPAPRRKTSRTLINHYRSNLSAGRTGWDGVVPYGTRRRSTTREVVSPGRGPPWIANTSGPSATTPRPCRGVGRSAIAPANPGTYDLSLHGPNGFFRHFAGSPATVLQVEAHADHNIGKLTLRLDDGGRRHGARRRGPRVVVDVADAMAPTSRSSCVGQARSRSTPGTPAVGTTSR
jgi:hypothetical protein